MHLLSMCGLGNSPVLLRLTRISFSNYAFHFLIYFSCQDLSLVWELLGYVLMALQIRRLPSKWLLSMANLLQVLAIVDLIICSVEQVHISPWLHACWTLLRLSWNRIKTSIVKLPLSWWKTVKLEVAFINANDDHLLLEELSHNPADPHALLIVLRISVLGTGLLQSLVVEFELLPHQLSDCQWGRNLIRS